MPSKTALFALGVELWNPAAQRFMSAAAAFACNPPFLRTSHL